MTKCTNIIPVQVYFAAAKKTSTGPWRAEKLLKPLTEKQPLMETAVSHSFLQEPPKRGYLLCFKYEAEFFDGEVSGRAKPGGYLPEGMA